ncbi:MAG TPA: S9 family peptidase [Thermoanaerobaculia bacterium]|nr:S9 family peptidase [Thermoanaerobaculia bacterium]
MTRILPLLALALALPVQGEAPRQVRRYTIDQLLATTVFQGDSISPDGRKILVSSNQTGVFNAFAVPVDGGAPVQLTDSKVNAIRVLGWFPRDERFLYVSDQGGDERTHLYVQSPDGKVRDLTPGDKLKAELMGWSPDDRSFFFRSNERDPSLFDVYEMTLDGYERKLLFTNPGGFIPVGVSPDRRYVALGKAQSTIDNDVHLHDRTSGKTALLTPDEQPGAEVDNAFQTFSPDGSSLYYTTDQGAEFKRLMRYDLTADLTAGRREEVLRPDWDVAGAGFLRSGKHLMVAVNADSRMEIRVFEVPGMRPLELPRVPDASLANVEISRDGRWMAYYAESGSTPANLYVRDLQTGKDRQLTRSLGPDIDPADLVTGEVVRFKSYDGVEIPGILYKPHQASPTGRVPAVVRVHGGPGGQAEVDYHPMIQYLVNHGYAVFDINNRGSSGYGKTFYAMDDRKHGDADLDDCVASKKMLAATGWIDPDRIGIYGASYGGYMVLAALAFRPREFAAGVDIYGISNWKRTMESIPAWWGAMRDALIREIGDPEKDAEALLRKSPLFHADRIERPLLVLQGENDPRVLKRESDSIVEAVKKRGVPVEYVVFENEGHGFSRKESQKKAYEAVLAFLDKYLK